MLRKRAFRLGATSLAAAGLISGFAVSDSGPQAHLIARADLTFGRADIHIIKVRLPPGVGRNSQSWLGPVACPAPNYCIASGDYIDAYGVDQGLLVIGSGASWTAYTAPAPANAYFQADVGLDTGSIACQSPSSCIVTGSYNVGTYANRHGMLLTGSGSSWTATAMPLLAGIHSTSGSQLSAVTCFSLSSCVVAGSYEDSSALGQGVLLTGSGTSWSVIRTPVSADAVACSTPTRCVAVGSYVNESVATRECCSLAPGTHGRRSRPRCLRTLLPLPMATKMSASTI